jgi:hypothetical protein
MWLNFYRLRAEPGKFGTPQFVYKQRKGKNLIDTYIYGGKLTENVVQATGAAVLKYQTNALTPYARPLMTTHDELSVIVPVAMEQAGLKAMSWALSQTPPWAEGLVLKGAVDSADRYGDCK